MKSMSTMDLRNEKTGVVETYELQDEAARKALESKAEQKDVDNIKERMSKKAEQETVDYLDEKVTKMINDDTASGIQVSGTKLVIRV